MIGYKFNQQNSRIFSEAGSAILEFAIVMPILTLLAFAGYNLMRDMEVNILKRDFVRSLSQSYACAFKQHQVAKELCYMETVNNLAAYANSKAVLKSNSTDVVNPGQFYYSIHTYNLIGADGIGIKTIDADETAIANAYAKQVSITRQGGCLGNDISDLTVNYVGGYTTPGFRLPHYDSVTVQARAGSDTIVLGDLFDGQNLDSQAKKVACDNGIITVIEVYFDSKSMFKISSGSGDKKSFYEFGFV